MKKIFFLLLIVQQGAATILAQSGNIGVGTNAPTSKLQVMGSLALGYKAITASTTLAVSDYAVEFTGSSAINLTLPDATKCAGRIYTMKNSSVTYPAPVVTMLTSLSQTIDAKSTWLINRTNEVITLTSNGTNWIVCAQNIPVPITDSTGDTWIFGGNAGLSAASTKKFGFTSDNHLAIITNNVERMRISDTGNIGIGTATPGSKLEISSGTANTSGLKFSSLNNSSPITAASAILGVDASGNVVVANSSSNARTNYVLVKSATDFPAPSGGVITLAATTLYEINGTITLTNKIDLNGATLTGADDANDKIIYTPSSGELFTGANGGTIKRLTLTAASAGAKLFNIDAANAIKNLIIHNCHIAGCANVGQLKGFGGLVYVNSVLYEYNTNGITFQDIKYLLDLAALWDSTNHNTYEKFTGVFCGIQKLDGAAFVSAANSAIAMDVSGITSMTGGASLKTNLLIGDGTYVTGSFSNKWEVETYGITTEKDDGASGNIYISSATATTFTAANTPVKLLGTTTALNLFRITAPVNNRLTYTGAKTRRFQLISSLTVTAAGNNKYLSFYIAKNGTLLPESEQMLKLTTGADAALVTISCTVQLATNDYIEVWVENNTDNTALTVQTMNLAMK